MSVRNWGTHFGCAWARSLSQSRSKLKFLVQLVAVRLPQACPDFGKMSKGLNMGLGNSEISCMEILGDYKWVWWVL